MCAPNQQNLEGTHDVVRNFSSPRVKALRGGRPLQLLVVSSRVEMREESLLNNFRGRFREALCRLHAEGAGAQWAGLLGSDDSL